MKTGITGGIGAGKSYVCGLLKARGIEVYDCDQAAKRLMRNSADIRQQLTTIIGADAYIDGVPNKAAIARFLLQSDVNAHAIDAIVHPAVFRDFEQSGMLWMESAILYESGIDRTIGRTYLAHHPARRHHGRQSAGVDSPPMASGRVAATSRLRDHQRRRGRPRGTT